MSAVAEQSWELCLEADETLQGVGDVRPSLARVLQLVQSAPEARHEFVQCFAELIQGRGPWEVAYFCMRHLRWPGVYRLVTDALRECDDFRVKNVMADIRDAYAEHPDDDYLYLRNSPGQTSLCERSRVMVCSGGGPCPPGVSPADAGLRSDSMLSGEGRG
jgi:hypothetical protein